ncbi:hypothetical protein SAMN05421788_112103 [Filimonas lacunae]|uniref:TIGR01777 family protein n=1 Tax=Filimonas lacunae TaxID=477680 RepID=A0A173MKX2_9BACT|nr:TIGR01777 family oxidoreductase [Filimonas lacunae]BAV08295.1 cell division inhibitor [Filimonas lacunae]SIT33283.1 hypothetical protein SAMN05421788_112103 [Filimonas lacunae]
MLYQKIVLAGGNGYLGGVLVRYFKDKAASIIILARKASPDVDNVQTIVWDGVTQGAWCTALEGADMLVNLCGKNVNCRYTAQNQRALLESRLLPTRALGVAVTGCKLPPELWINVTSATIYRHAEDKPQDEATGQIGYGFSIDICKAWESAFFDMSAPRTRKIALRMGIVLGRKDGVFPRLLNMVKLGLGGKHGVGEQYIAWIHEQDVAGSVEWLLQHTEIEGVINCTGPEPVRNKDLMKDIRRAYGAPFGLPAPQWLLDAGAMLIGTETELLLKSRWVAPQKLLDSGYVFLFTRASYAIHDILSIRI